MITVLVGGVGGARFLQGLAQIMPHEEITVIVNTGDDHDFYGLHVSPDIDTVIYTLAGIVEERYGWGIRDDTSYAMQQLTSYGYEDWFLLGDRDLATHIHRTNLLRQGKTISEITDLLRQHFSIKMRILPMSDQPVATFIQTPIGSLYFDEYLVKHRSTPEVQDILFIRSKSAFPAPGVLAALEQAEAILLAPSNPLVSIGTILAVPGIREALCRSAAKIVAVSPIVGGAPIKGPADKLMRGLGHEVSALGVACCYRDFLDVMVIDTQDAHLAPQIQALGIATMITNTIMHDSIAKANLAYVTRQAALVEAKQREPHLAAP